VGLAALRCSSPWYTYAGDIAPGQNSGNGLNVNGGLWRELTVSG
jgi:hypothetical protein